MALTLADLVRNRTMSPEMAATLATAAEERRSMLFVAIPRMAGKSTVMQAALMQRTEETSVHPLSSAAGRTLGIPDVGDDGYLLVSEFSPAGFDDYLWGADARAVFDALPRGFSVAAALHAGGVEEAFAVIHQNGVPDELAARIELVTYIRSIGPWQRPTRRVVAEIQEIDGMHRGVPRHRLLHRWLEADDRFEVVDAPERIGETVGSYSRHVGQFSSV